ncbi:MAG TPA: hypothetical protein VGC70_03485 [Burkholderiales bacterium]
MNQHTGTSPTISHVINSTHKAAPTNDPIDRWVWHLDMLQITVLASLLVCLVSVTLGLSWFR